MKIYHFKYLGGQAQFRGSPTRSDLIGPRQQYLNTFPKASWRKTLICVPPYRVTGQISH